ncbi:MAG: sigma 54-interacting transcriptional regulator [Phycisphaerae bacterium]|nr:sigma 54-interacting transcriptional regulator [Phycisphaerae bacterium]
MNTHTTTKEAADNRSRQDLEELIQFEELLSDLAATFVNLPVCRVDQEIEHGLERMADFLGADRGMISQFSEDRETLTVTHCFMRPGIKPLPLTSLRLKEHPLWYLRTLQKKEMVVMENLPDDLPEGAESERRLCIDQGLKSNISIPLLSEKEQPDGVIAFGFMRRKKKWNPQCIRRVQYIGYVFADILKRKQAEEALERAYSEIKRLKERLEAENIYLKQEVKIESSYGDILGHSDAIKSVMAQVEQVAGTDSTVLIQGETGTGKELIARAIHKLSSRRNKPMVRVNCAAIAPTLIESELFGHEKGAFTGASSRQIGRFEIANGSTIFLDEIGDLSADLQAKLLHVLELQQFERLGSSEVIDVDIRVVAATNRDLAAAVKEGSFREDLFYRLNVFPIQTPSLRERKEDIPMLVWAFVQELSVKMGKVIETIPRKAMEELQNYPWPGNVRELRNVIERAMILTNERALHVEMPKSSDSPHTQSLGLEDIEKNHIIDVLSMTDWRVRGKNGAAELLHLKPSTLESKMQKLGIKRPG